MLIILLLFVVLGVGTIIGYLKDLRKQNEKIIKVLDDLYDIHKENIDEK